VLALAGHDAPPSPSYVVLPTGWRPWAPSIDRHHSNGEGSQALSRRKAVILITTLGGWARPQPFRPHVPDRAPSRYSCPRGSMLVRRSGSCPGFGQLLHMAEPLTDSVRGQRMTFWHPTGDSHDSENGCPLARPCLRVPPRGPCVEGELLPTEQEIAPRWSRRSLSVLRVPLEPLLPKQRAVGSSPVSCSRTRIH